MRNKNLHSEKLKQVGASRIGRVYSLIDPKLRNTKDILKKKGKILDLGCGKGNKFFLNGEIYGVDLSFHSLKVSKKIYKRVILADVTKLPFKTGSFDSVVSWDVYAHIPYTKKIDVITEVYRVLTKGGECAIIAETDSSNRLFRFAKSYPHLFNKYFIEQDGHIGLERIGKIKKRFESAGFNIISVKPIYSNVLMYSDEYLKRFNNEYKNKSKKIKLLVSSLIILKKIKVSYFLDFIFEILGRFLDNFGKLDSASAVFIRCERDS